MLLRLRFGFCRQSYAHSGNIIPLSVQFAFPRVKFLQFVIGELTVLIAINLLLCFIYLVCRTPWTGDQPCRKAATYTRQHKYRRNAKNIHTSSGIRTHDPSVSEGEFILFLRPRGHCNRPRVNVNYVFFQLVYFHFTRIYNGVLFCGKKNVFNR
jgi:hypothetical protein